MNIKKLVVPNVQRLTAYSAKEIPCKVKLDANESPFSVFEGSRGLASGESPWRQRVKVQKTLQKLNRYPDPEAKELKKILAKNLGVNPENILLGNGSDELIYYLITTFGGPALYPTPTFSMYGIISQALGQKKIEIPLDNEFDLDTEKILNAVKRDKPKLIFLSSPNNPTGNCFSSERILKIISASKGIVVVDEAYQPFSSEKGFLPLSSDYKNLIILRTLSKIGFAGLRVGFMIAGKEIIDEVNKVRLPFNVNSLSQSIAISALRQKKSLNAVIRAIISERERLMEAMEKIKGIKPYPSEANFILFKAANSDKIYAKLLKKGVLVRNMKGVVNGGLRVTVGTEQENNIFIKALRGVMK